MWRDFAKDFEKAEIYYLKALEIDHNTPAINGSYGYLLYLMGDYEKAMKYIEKELKINKRNKWAYFYHGLLNKIQGNDEIAEKELLRAISVMVCTDKHETLKHL